MPATTIWWEGGGRDNSSQPLHKWKSKAKTNNFLEEDITNIKKVKQVLLIQYID